MTAGTPPPCAAAPKPPLGHLAALDGLRAVAVLLVLAFHARVPGLQGGLLGVDVFFVLSGYLITRLLLQEHAERGRIDAAAFYGRRLRRLYPALLLMLGAYLVWAPWAFQHRAIEHGRDALLAVLYLADYARAFWQAPVVLQHTWSLAVEAHFYLLWPAVLIALLRLPPTRRVQVLLLLYLAALAWRSHNMLSVRDWAGVYYAFDTRLAGLLLGALAACGGRELGRGWAWLGLLALAVAVLQARWKADATILLWMPLAEIGTALLVSAAGALRAWSHDALAWLGRMSYGLYLWHYPVMYWMRPQGFAWVETLAVGSLVGLAGAVLSYYTVERAFRRQRLAAPCAARASPGPGC